MVVTKAYDCVGGRQVAEVIDPTEISGSGGRTAESNVERTKGWGGAVVTKERCSKYVECEVELPKTHEECPMGVEHLLDVPVVR